MKDQFISTLVSMEASQQNSVLNGIVSRLVKAIGKGDDQFDSRSVIKPAQFAGDIIEWTRKGRKASEKQITGALNALERGWGGVQFVYLVSDGKVGFKAIAQ